MKVNRFHYQGADRQIGELKHTRAKMTQHGHRVLSCLRDCGPESTENHFARSVVMVASRRRREWGVRVKDGRVTGGKAS